MSDRSPDVGQPLITAVVLTYNVARYLSDFLEQASTQTNSLENAEFLFVVDSSPGDSGQIIEPWFEG